MASGASLRESGLGKLSEALRGCGEDRLLVDQVVPDLQKSYLGIAAHPPDIGLDHRVRSLLSIGAVAAEKERSNRSARGQPLEVPLPRPGKNLVKIVDCENQVALRRREQTEIHQMHIAAGHHLDIGARGICEISCHDCGASRKKANGEVSMRAIRTGTSSLMRVAFCVSRTETGSGRPRAGRNTHGTSAVHGYEAPSHSPSAQRKTNGRR